MAQTARNAKSTSWVYGFDTSNITALRAAIASGGTITASNITAITTLLTYALSHYHTYDDAYQLATYGAGYGQSPGAGDRNNYYENKNTAYPAYVPGSGPTSVSSGGDITAAQHNEMATSANFSRAHYHQIDDRTA